MEIRQAKVYRGPSTWGPMPVVELLLDMGQLGDRPTGTISGFGERLAALISALGERGRPSDDPGGVLAATGEGTGLARVVERLALGLQTLVGDRASRGETRGAGAAGRCLVAYGYAQEEVGLLAGRLAVRLVGALAAGDETAVADPGAVVEELERVAERVGYGPSTGAIVAEAARRGIPVSRPDRERAFVLLGHGHHQRRLWATATDGTSLVAAYTAGDKELTGRLLRDAGIPTPSGGAVADADEAARLAARLGFPVVVKPRDGNHGRGVALGLADAEAVRAAFAAAARASKTGRAMVQRQVAGRDYRLLVVGDRVVAAAERIAAHVVGDGRRTVRELVAAANADPRRGVGHRRPLTRLREDDAATDILAGQGLGWADVPEPGRHVRLAATANLSAGGTAIDRTDEVHPLNAELARDAALIVGLDVAGVDVVTPDIGRPLTEDGGAMVEVNAAPGFRMHTDPSEGQPRDVGRAVVDLLFPPGAPARVPIVAVTGTNGKTTTTRMVAHLLRAAGHRVGLTTTDGIYLDGRLLEAGDSAGPGSARALLRHPRVEAAALETARGGLLREGLGFDACDVAIVTNIASDHLGLGGVETLEDLARVKAVVPASVRPGGASVLNADDPLVVAMAGGAGGEVVFFGGDEANPILRDHLAAGGRAGLLARTPAGDALRFLSDGNTEDLLPAAEIPATLGGLLRVNALNALAAALAAWTLGIPTETIRAGLRSFEAGFATTPGRFNLLEVEGRRVVIDYAHNVAALEAFGDYVRRLGAPRAVAMLAIPGDRSDEDTTALGLVAGAIFDAVVIREAANTRGRPRGESAELLRRAVLAGGVAEAEIRVVLDEVEAAHATVDLAAPGDLAAIFVTRPKVIWEELSARAAG